MSNKAQVNKALQDLGMYFAEKGKILSTTEYVDSPDRPIRLSHLRRIFRSYSRMVQMLENREPDLFSLAQEKPVEEQVEKPKTSANGALAAAKAAAAAAKAVDSSTQESSDADSE